MAKHQNHPASTPTPSEQPQASKIDASAVDERREAAPVESTVAETKEARAARLKAEAEAAKAQAAADARELHLSEHRDAAHARHRALGLVSAEETSAELLDRYNPDVNPTPREPEPEAVEVQGELAGEDGPGLLAADLPLDEALDEQLAPHTAD